MSSTPGTTQRTGKRPRAGRPSFNGFPELFRLGLRAAQSGNLAAAKDLFGRAVSLEPGHSTAHANLGTVLSELRQWQDALASFDRAIALNGNHAVAYSNRGNVLKQLERWDDALASYDRALDIEPKLAEAHSNRTNVLAKLEQWDAALASCNRAIVLDPGLAEAHLNRGIVFRELKRLDVALASYDQAIALKRDYAEAYCNRGVVLHELGQPDAALSSYAQAIAIKPYFPEAYFNRSLVSLALGDFVNGWRDYEWRWNNDKGSNISDRRFFIPPLWLGVESIAGKRILLHGEQGLGDTLQFCRYVKRVADLGASVILEVPEVLVGLLGTMLGVSHIVARGAPLPAFDFHCPLLSLPLAFKTTLDTIPHPGRYLRTNASKVAYWQTKLGEKTRPRVGLVWSGANRPINDRSVGLAGLIGRLPTEIQYVSLQKEVRGTDVPMLRGNPGVLDFRDELTDFSDTGALCECMDLVVSVDTSVAHLSGALGVKTWILLASHADWRWLVDGNASPWYASVTLYRQRAVGDWSAVFARVAEDMRRTLL